MKKKSFVTLTTWIKRFSSYCAQLQNQRGEMGLCKTYVTQTTQFVTNINFLYRGGRNSVMVRSLLEDIMIPGVHPMGGFARIQIKF
jgi:hypothetical protein